MAWSAIGANKMRTFLTMLGIIIGVASLIVLVSITEGATTSVSEQISDIGSNYLTVSVSDDKENPLRLSEFTSLLQDDVFSASSPAAMTSVTAKSGYTDETMRLTGVTGGYFQIMDSQLATAGSTSSELTIIPGRMRCIQAAEARLIMKNKM